MKKLILLLAVTIIGLQAQARLKIPVCIPCEKIAIVKDLPKTDDFKDESGNYLKLGYYYKEYGAVFIPAWNSEGQYVLTNESEDMYYELSAEQIQELKDTHKIELPSGNPLSFWKKIGGKIIFILIIGAIIWGMIPEKDEPEKAS